MPQPVQRNTSDLQNLFDTVVNTIKDGVITIDLKGEIQSYNPACVKLFGYNYSEVIGKNISMLMPEPYRANHDHYINHYLATNIPKIIGSGGREVMGQRKDGSVFPMELIIGDTQRCGVHAFVGIVRDIRDRREGEAARQQLQQAQKMEALGQLTGGIAHDFNNLLAIILGNIDFLLERLEKDDPLRNYITPAIDAALHGSELTKQLLAFGRKQALQPKVVSLNAVIEHFSTLVKRTLGDWVEISIKLDPKAWNVKIDPHLFENTLLNLAVNARDAMPTGGKLIFETHNITFDHGYAEDNPDVQPGDYAMVAVSDTGTGMPPEVIEKAFEPFFTTKDVGKGSGMGLSMVYGFVRQSNGHIKIYSEVGRGTSIKIYFPRADGERVELSHAVLVPKNPMHKNKRVLVLEDNPEVLKITSSMVESLGYDVVTAPNGIEALAILEARGDIDLLVTDVMLPGSLNGPAVAKQALELNPKLKVLFNSGYAEHAIFESGILEKGVALISKPFRKPDLALKIDEILDSD